MSKFNAAMLEAGMIPGDLGAFKKEAGKIKLYFGGGGGGGNNSTQSTGTTYTTNIPEYAKPYVESMLGATQQQLFDTRQTPSGDIELTGFRPYTPYSTNMQDYIAPFSPMQKAAMAETAALSTPEQFGYGTEMAGRAGLGALTTAEQAGMAGRRYESMATSPYATRAYMSPYIESALTPQLREMERQYALTGIQEKGKAAAAGAFGGTRDALMQAENQRNKNIAMNQAIGQGYQNAFQAAQQAQQFGANLGLQGQQAALQGYGTTGQLGSQLGQLGTQELAATQGILGAQYQMGSAQQAQQQAMINQAIQNYATAQQYPLMQLGFMSNMLRGLPMQATSTQQYVATPSNYQQAIGAAGTGASMYNALKAKGGIVDSKKMASGGIVGYDVGGKIESILDDMTIEQLKEEVQRSSSPSVKKMAAKLMAEKRMAGGGIVAFAEGTPPPDEEPEILKASEETSPEQVQVTPAPKKAAPQPQGIIQAAPEAAGVGEAINKSSLPEYLKAPIRAQLAENTKSQEQILAERKAARDKYVGEDVAAQEYRSKIMAERANAEDEASRQKWMRAAEFFASWGSTPGPMIAAGLQSMKKTLPGLIADKDAQKKYMRELDKSIYDIDKAARLEKMGEWDEATKIKEAQAKSVQGIVTSLTNIYEADQRNKATMAAAGTKESADDKALNNADKEVERRIKSEKTRMGIKERQGTLTGEDLQYLDQLEQSVREQVYKERGIKIPEAPMNAPKRPEVVAEERAKAEKIVKENTPSWYQSDTPEKKAKREQAQRVLDGAGGNADNKDRKPLSSFDKKSD